jgi:hypothetical protein
MFGRAKSPTTAFLVIVSLITSFRFGWADSWGPPPKEHWSNDRQFVLFVSEVTWGQSKLVLGARSERISVAMDCPSSHPRSGFHQRRTLCRLARPMGASGLRESPDLFRS